MRNATIEKGIDPIYGHFILVIKYEAFFLFNFVAALKEFWVIFAKREAF